MFRVSLEEIIHLLRRHIPIWLLAIWVVVIMVLPIPWRATPLTDSSPAMHEVILLSSGTDKLRSIAYEAVLLDSSAALIQPELLLYFSRDSAFCFSPGDHLIIYSQIEQGRAFVQKGAVRKIDHLSLREIGFTEGKIQVVSNSLRDAIERRLEALILPSKEDTEQYAAKQQSLALLESLLLGDRRQLQPDQRDAFADSGAMHVLAVSGLHVGIIAAIILWILSLGYSLVIPWEYYRLRRLQRVLAITLIWGYAFLTGMSVSVMRSALMFSLMPLGNLHIESTMKYNRLAAAALIILLINPNAIQSPSFLLSFSAVWAIMYYFSRWKRYIPLPTEKGSVIVRTMQSFRTSCLELLAISTAAQIGTLPFTLLFFGQMANYFLLTNCIVLPLAQFLVIPLSLLALLFSCFPFPHLTHLLIWIAERSAYLMNTSVRWIQHLPGATTFLTVTPALILQLIGFIVSFTLFFRVLNHAPLQQHHPHLRWTLLALTLLASIAFLIAFLYGYAQVVG